MRIEVVVVTVVVVVVKACSQEKQKDIDKDCWGLAHRFVDTGKSKSTNHSVLHLEI